MIYVFTKDYRQFQNFLQEFQLCEHLANGGNREGQVSYLGSDEVRVEQRLRGNSHALVLAWGTYFERRDFHFVEDMCRALDIPLIVVPELQRERAYREHPEHFRRF